MSALIIIAGAVALLASFIAYAIKARSGTKEHYAGRRDQLNGTVDRSRTGEYVHGVIDQMLIEAMSKIAPGNVTPNEMAAARRVLGDRRRWSR